MTIYCDSGTWIDTDMECKFIRPLNVTWNPQPDITAYELSLIIPFLFHSEIMPGDLNALPQECLRHLVIHDPNKEEEK